MPLTTAADHMEQRRLLAAQEAHESEWWYYHGHLSSADRRFAFHLAFFRFRIDDIRLAGLVPLKLAGEHFRVAHFGITELDNGKFHYGCKRSLGSRAGASAPDFGTWLDDWSARETDAAHHLHASIRQARINLVATPQKQALVRLWTSEGASPTMPRSGEICFTRMNASGRIRLGNEEIFVTGSAWMDREFGKFPLKHGIRGWDWLALQLEDGTELRIYHVRSSNGSHSPVSSLALINAAGIVTWLEPSAYSLRGEACWTSPRTGISYPTKWFIEIPCLRASLRLDAAVQCNELDTRGSSNVIYWEGPAEVSGHIDGVAVAGRSFIELVGYQGSPAPAGVFDFSRNRLGLWDSLFNEFRQRLYGPGVSVSDRQTGG